ncbi:DUF971 domain-containing protein [Blastopirellula marina]|uniref:Gamma-butyrobetaine hydroxylase-like N-terminal domain-containing protein n=1 Tax=Blastopirellula marina DSM 3645 TaxID=314230 RepID=A4A2D1_9BACT|nr:DUF971 domain-containing protein [Blastopirellula marina]EAQ77097.1 hypothetical protein DSM3645_25724 [Blastopirellula marina DSM 3645]
MTPADIQADRPNRTLKIEWSDGQTGSVDFWSLRVSCRCARCISEHTDERILNPDDVPRDVSIDSMELVGGYAIKIRWTDGHDTGLYTWEHLREATIAG